MSIVAFKLIYVLLMKCTFTYDTPDAIRTCQYKVYKVDFNTLKGEKK